MSVFVLDKQGKPLMPCTEKRARLLLERGRARVHRVVPFVIRLIDRKAQDSDFQPVRVKLDPGSKTTGIAVVRESGKEQSVLRLINLAHRGRQISESLTARRQMRRRRRSQLRYRAPRFNNRAKAAKWLAPSLRHRVETTMSWVQRINRWAPMSAVSMELVRFDLQKHENPEISGAEYQQGELAGYEVREYLLEKWGRKCAYCSAENVPLQVEHIVPKARGGSNRISNLTLACQPCNQKKGAMPVEQFLAKKPDLLKRIQAQAKRPLKDAAAVNSTRWAMAKALEVFGVVVEKASGGRTKYNRTRLGIPKDHALDAACVGDVESVNGWRVPVLKAKAMGRGTHQRTKLDKYGFPRGYCMRTKFVKGFQTGDLVKAVVPKGKHTGTLFGRVAVRATGSFNVGAAQGINAKHCSLVQRACGYQFG
jgi:5-methylcytosine-specific restriction endonuclease McrA